MSEIRTVPCPMCGRSAGRQVILKPGSTYRKQAVVNFWESTLAFDPDKPFGITMETTGRGSLHKVGTFQPDEDQEYFPLVKARLLNVIKEWVAKGWANESDVAMAARGMVAPVERLPAKPKKGKR